MLPIINDKSITVFVDNRPLTVRSDHVNFYAIKRACQQKRYDLIPSLVNVERTVQSAVTQTQNKTVEVRNGQVLYRGQPLHNVVSQKVISMVRDGVEDVTPWIKFIERLMQNPDRNSTEQLFNFLSVRELPIDEEGFVYGYKGVSARYWSVRGNTQTRVLKGKTDEEGRIWNGVGEEIEVERNCVVNDPKKDCAEGVHVGSYEYAKGWGEKVMLVKFDPKDAVSVPQGDWNKLRACKYTVIAEVNANEGEIRTSMVSAKGKESKIEMSDQDLRLAVADMIRLGYVVPISLHDMLAEQMVHAGADITQERVNRQAKIVSRILNYVDNRAGPILVKSIQSALSGLANISYKEIEHILSVVKNSKVYSSKPRAIIVRP